MPYKLPSNLDPDENECIQVYVPKDTEWRSVFWGAFSELARYFNHELDGTHAAADVAARWRQCYLLTEQAYQEGNCMSFQLRQNPANPCQLQQSTDGGDTWTLAFDYRLCSNVITAPAPFPGSETGDVDAAANVIKNIHSKLMDIADANCAGSRDTAISEMLTWLRQYDAGYAGTGNLGAIYDAYCDMTPEQQDEARELGSLCSQFESLSECANVDGVFDALDCLNELLVTWLNNTATDLMSLLDKAAGAMSPNGIQWAAGDGAAGGGADFGAACAPSASGECDFTVEQCGWYANGGATYWLLGEGYEQGSYNTPSVIDFDFDAPVTITQLSITLEYDNTYDSSHWGVSRSINVFFDGGGNEQVKEDSGYVDHYGIDNPFTWIGSKSNVTKVRFYISHNVGDHRLYDIIHAAWTATYD